MTDTRQRYLTVEQMRETDRRCIEELGIPGAVLMNNAGTAVFQGIREGTVAVVCGKGNNGGDGFVVARLALLAGLDTRVVLLGMPEAVKGDAAVFMNAYRKLGGPVECVEDEDGAARAVAALNGAGTLVDAMLGSGITGEVRGKTRAAIDAWPPGYTVALDIPSGMNADTGEAGGACIKADVTVTMQFPFAGFAQPAAEPYLGRLIVADIGIPRICADDDAWAALTAQW